MFTTNGLAGTRDAVRAVVAVLRTAYRSVRARRRRCEAPGAIAFPAASCSSSSPARGITRWRPVAHPMSSRGYYSRGNLLEHLPHVGRVSVGARRAIDSDDRT